MISRLRTPSTDPRTLALRWAVAATLLLLTAGFLFAMQRFYSDKFHRTTGDASWIWSHHRVAADVPEAFFLVRQVEIPLRREFVRIRVAADPEYTLWFNGLEIGGGTSDGRILQSWDVTPLARSGRNTIVIAVRSPRGVGGVLACVDFGPLKRNRVVTDGEWRLYHRWSDALLRGGTAGASEPPRLLGRPPFGRWNYPAERAGVPYPSRRIFRHPREVRRFEGWLPRIEVKSGVAVAGRVAAPATAFDFGPVAGRAAIRVEPGAKRAVAIRYAGSEEDLLAGGTPESLVVIEGEEEVVSAQPRAFRYLIVYGEPVDAWVVVGE